MTWKGKGFQPVATSRLIDHGDIMGGSFVMLDPPTDIMVTGHQSVSNLCTRTSKGVPKSWGQMKPLTRQTTAFG